MFLWGLGFLVEWEAGMLLGSGVTPVLPVMMIAVLVVVVVVLVWWLRIV